MRASSLSFAFYFLGLVLVSIYCLVSGGSLGIGKAAYGNESLARDIENYNGRRLITNRKFMYDQNLIDSSYLYGERKRNVDIRSKRDVLMGEMDIYNMSRQIDPFIRFVTTRTAHLIEDLKLFRNTTGIPFVEKDEFAIRIIGLLSKMMAGEKLILEGPDPDLNTTRCYTPNEIDDLKRLRDSIVGTLNGRIELSHRVNKKISEMNGTSHACTNLTDYLKNNEDGEEDFADGIGDTLLTAINYLENIESMGDNLTDGMGDNLTSKSPNSSVNPLNMNIFVFNCMNQVNMESLRDLIECVGMEIAKGQETITEANFYLSVIDSLEFIGERMHTMNSRLMALYSPGYDGPSP